jgi:hypothetical protein
LQSVSEFGQLLLIWQFAFQQQKSHFLESGLFGELLNRVSAVGEPNPSLTNSTDRG